MSTLVSISNDRTFKIWNIDKLECLFESPQLGQFSLTSSAILESGTPPADSSTTTVPSSSTVTKTEAKKKQNTINKTSIILALGNCDGKIMFYDISTESEGRKIKAQSGVVL